MAVRIRMKKMGRRHRPFFRICAIDSHAPRDGRVIEQLGTYDPMVPETDARVSLNNERLDYWMSVGALPSHKVGVLIRKYGTDGTHLAQQKLAIDKIAADRGRVFVPVAVAPKPVVEETPAETPAADPVETVEEPVVETPAEPVAEAPAETPVEAPAEPVAEAPAETPVEAPAEAVAETPAEPVAETPAEETTDTPTQE